MKCYTALTTIRKWIAPKHELFCSFFVWRRLLMALRERGQCRARESGAFLLGTLVGNVRYVVSFVPYDDLDPACLGANMIEFDGTRLGALWDICRQRGLSVVADIHVHPGPSEQSSIDRANPMISTPGHVALILPYYAKKGLRRRDIGIFRYLGDGSWSAVPRGDRRAFFCIGL